MEMQRWFENDDYKALRIDLRSGSVVSVLQGFEAAARPQPAARPHSASVSFKYSADSHAF